MDAHRILPKKVVCAHAQRAGADITVIANFWLDKAAAVAASLPFCLLVSREK